MDKIIYGGDSETLNGEPLSFQFYSEDIACNDMMFVNAKGATQKFIQWCDKRKPHMLHVIYVHNLSFDLPEFFWGCKEKLVENGGEFDFTCGGWRVRGVYGTPTFCRMTDKHGRSIMLIDSFSFFRGSLERAAELFCPDLPKLKRPKGLGEIKFTARDTVFCEYAMRDSEVDYHIGKQLDRLHEEFDLPQSLSIADMASNVFRKHYLNYTIPQPSRDIIEASLLSYHGGKNNLACAPGWHEDVNAIDISSAYPEALASLPSMDNADAYTRYTAKSMRALPPSLGVYLVSGRLKECSWPVIFSHGFKPLKGPISDVWVQGYELREAMASGEFIPSSIKGYFYDIEEDFGAPAFRAFVEDFYRRKETEKDPVLRQMYKFILNSISGKLIQTKKRGNCAFTDVDAGVTSTAAELVAGGMFHPFLASAVTARPRARIHELEHEHKALHTATDGIMTQNRRAAAVGKGLGSLTLEAKGATALIVRNKCYVLYLDKPTPKTFPSRAFDGKHILKSALHGFQGSVFDLERLIATNKRKYTVNRPNRLKDALKRGKVPNLFEKREFTLKVPPLGVQS